MDYKRSESLSRDPKRVGELSKDVSSFANSAGGTLIYGVLEENRHPVGVDDGTDPTDLDRERLENLIHGNVRPRIPELVVRAAPLETGNLLYVVVVGQSSTAHMAADHRYYKRFNFKAEPMEHYEVEDVMQRPTTPDIRVFMSSRLEALSRLNIQVFAQNLSPVPATFFAISVFVPTLLERKYIDSPPYTPRGPVEVKLPEFTENFDVVTFEWYDRLPLISGAPVRIGSFDVNSFPGHWLLWEVQSVGRPKRATIFVAADGLHDKDLSWREVLGPMESR